MEKGVLADFKVERKMSPTLVGTIHKGKVIRVLPGMQVAFVDIGLERAAFLYVGDVRSDEGSLSQELEESEDGDKEGWSQILENKPKIQELLQPGQPVLVQVSKDPVGTKGARITTHISLASRKIVYLPTLDHIGISRRIESSVEREGLKKILEKINPSGGVIVRTAGEGMVEEDIISELDYLEKTWDQIQSSYAQEQGFGLLYSELDFELRVLRDFLNQGLCQVLIDHKESYEKALEFASQYMPQFKNSIEFYSDKEGLLDRYRVALDISKALNHKVWLRSGGYLVIEETEALVVIDVNTGRYVGKKDLEETIFQTNMEAIREISHQIRLRDCGGIIVVDFIDMKSKEHRDKILQALSQEVKSDSARVSVVSMTGLGLVEMTRKRLRPSLLNTLTQPCFYCDGMGRLKRKETLVADIFRELKTLKEKSPGVDVWIVNCHGDLVSWVYGEESELISQIQGDLGVSVIFKADSGCHWEEFRFETPP